MYIVYLLEHSDTLQTYVGFTQNLKQRLLAHNARGRKYTTRTVGVWNLIYAEAYRSEVDARAREKKLKIHGSAMHSLLKRLSNSRLSQK